MFEFMLLIAQSDWDYTSQVLQDIFGSRPWWYWVPFLLVNLPLCYLAGMLFMGGRDEMLECFRYFIQPDSWSLFKGELAEDFFATLKVLVWLFASLAFMTWQHLWLWSRFFASE